ncbi:transposase [Endozoicomonas euniceicola]|uniref:transposase n=1 Tax=Endozoicomonas euniceicola TaxID=1234143 RepID=UPI0038506EB9
MVVRWNEKKQKWAFIVTNLARAEFTLSEVLQAYRLRWQVELIFKEIKSYSGWHRFNTKSATLVFSLILMSFVVVTLKMESVKRLMSCIRKLLLFWEQNAKREYPARDGYSGRTHLGLCKLGGALP